jgi:transposase
MESTGDYWKGAYWLLEAAGFECWLVNARDVKNVPGRPKTDKHDAVWLAKVAERGMCRPSLVQPCPIRELRDLTRYRRALYRDRTREMQRVEKLLEDAQIKLSSVISDIFGVSGREMLEALIGGQRDPKVLARMARARMRAKITVLEEALSGFFTDHHAGILQMMLDNIDRLSGQIAALDARIEATIAPFAAQLKQLDEIPAVGVTAAQELIAEIGVDTDRFPSAAHLVSWAKFCPHVHESAGRKKNTGRDKGNPWLAGALGNIAAGAARTDTWQSPGTVETPLRWFPSRGSPRGGCQLTGLERRGPGQADGLSRSDAQRPGRRRGGLVALGGRRGLGSCRFPSGLFVDRRRQHAAGGVPPFGVVFLQVVGHRPAGLCSGGERGLVAEQFELDGGVEALRDGVV